MGVRDNSSPGTIREDAELRGPGVHRRGGEQGEASWGVRRTEGQRDCRRHNPEQCRSCPTSCTEELCCIPIICPHANSRDTIWFQPAIQVLSILRVKDAVSSALLPELWQAAIVRLSNNSVETWERSSVAQLLQNRSRVVAPIISSKLKSRASSSWSNIEWAYSMYLSASISSGLASSAGFT